MKLNSRSFYKFGQLRPPVLPALRASRRPGALQPDIVPSSQAAYCDECLPDPASCLIDVEA